MIRLDLKREPHWLDLGHGVRVQVLPLTSAMMLAARAACGAADEDRMLTLLRSLGEQAILAWDGVGDADGQPALLSQEGVAALLDLWPMAEAFERLYLGPALLLDGEKNA